MTVCVRVILLVQTLSLSLYAYFLNLKRGAFGYACATSITHFSQVYVCRRHVRQSVRQHRNKTKQRKTIWPLSQCMCSSIQKFRNIVYEMIYVSFLWRAYVGTISLSLSHSKTYRRLFEGTAVSIHGVALNIKIHIPQYLRSALLLHINSNRLFTFSCLLAAKKIMSGNIEKNPNNSYICIHVLVARGEKVLMKKFTIRRRNTFLVNNE